MRLHAGTSGYSYAEWKGTFYPDGMPASKMLAFYARHFDTVEINNTYYRMPRPAMLATWAAQVPDSFLFALKAPVWITQKAREDAVGQFCDVAATLGSRLGPLLFRFQPTEGKDVGRLRDFLAMLPAGPRVAMEFRYDSWFDDDVYAVLRERDVAVC